MKLSKVIFSIIVAAGFVACSSDEDGAQSSDTQVNALYSDVEIRFGSSNQTRATTYDGGAIDNSTEDVAVDGLGIFMLAKQTLGINPDEASITWLRTGGNLWGAPEDEDNAKANVVFAAGGGVSEITWADRDEHGDPILHYYPAGNWYGYRFFGYYPRKEGSDEIATETQRKIHYGPGDLNGKTDIICGKTSGWEYCARYFRKAENAGKYPTIEFEHVLMCFQFAIQGSPDENEAVGHQYDTANRMKVKSIKVKDIPVSANLVVADLYHEGNEGKLEYDWAAGTQDLDVKEKTGEEPWKIHDDAIIPIGEALMVPVIDRTYEVEIVLIDTNTGKEFEVEKPLQLKANSEYAKGTRYQILIQIAGAQAISLKATLTPWVEDDSTFNHLELN